MKKHITRENIHAGLSGGKSDEKWSDVLNFRFTRNRTFAVPFKKILLTLETGLHSLVNGLENRFYVFGEKSSYTFLGHDDLKCEKLWRGTVLPLGDKKESKLYVRGVYTGSETRRFRVIYAEGVVKVVPVEIEEEEEVTGSIDCGLGVGNNEDLYLEVTVKNTANELLSNVTLEFIYGVVPQSLQVTGGAGMVKQQVDLGNYQIRATHPQYLEGLVQYEVLPSPEVQSVEIILLQKTTGWSVYVGHDSLSGSATFGPSSNYAIIVNGVNIGPVNLENNIAGLFISETYIITEEQAEAIALNTTSNTFNLLLQNNGTFTSDNPHIVIKNANSEVLFDGLPVTRTATVNL